MPSVYAASIRPLVFRLSLLVLAGPLCSPAANALTTQLLDQTFNMPLFLTAPVGDSRLFVVERAGVVKVLSGGTWSTFLDITAKVDAQGEHGLLGLAFDPNFKVQGAAGFGSFYVDYIDRTSLDTRIERYTVSANPNLANTTATPVLTIDQPAGRFTHKAGWIGFRPNENHNLYIATGDGGGVNDPGGNGQNINTQLGKILRVNVHADSFPTDASRNYAIPTGNPFATGGAPEVWDYGLRNPYRDSFDRATGDLYIGDVGEKTREEIDFEFASSAGGVNYGWRKREGSVPNPTPGFGGDVPGAQDPVYDYGRGSAPFQGGTVIGGYVYRGSLLQDTEGEYFFGDYVSGQIWSLRVDPATGEVKPGSLLDRTAELNAAAIGNIVSFGEDGFGNLYILDLEGKIYALVPEPSTYAMLVPMLAALLWVGLRKRAKQ